MKPCASLLLDSSYVSCHTGGMTTSIGYIGLGNMGQAMVSNLLEKGVSVVGYNRTHSVTEQFNNTLADKVVLQHASFIPAYSLKDMIINLQAPRIIFMMVKAGEPVDMVIEQLAQEGLEAGDIIIDGGNSLYTESIKRGEKLHEKKIHYIDCGTSGGIQGARTGACLMLGGDKEVIDSLSWLWNTIAVDKGWTHFGDSGAGHFVKMVHNGVEYGMEQAIGEGFEILVNSRYPLDLEAVAKNWKHGSVVRSWLIELLADALHVSPQLQSYKGVVGGGTTGSWAKLFASKVGVSTPVLDASIEARKNTHKRQTFTGKVISALRYGFGAHEEPVPKQNKQQTKEDKG